MSNFEYYLHERKYHKSCKTRVIVASIASTFIGLYIGAGIGVAITYDVMNNKEKAEEKVETTSLTLVEDVKKEDVKPIHSNYKFEVQERQL